MNAIVVYESIYGNTRAVAEAVADGLGGATVLSVQRASGGIQQADLVVVGGPTHMHGIATPASRRTSVETAKAEGIHVEPGVADQDGLREWLHALPRASKVAAATFDTRLDKSAWLTGMAARRIARQLRRHGYDVLEFESFLVKEAEGPLEDGELERAREWGAHLASRVAQAVHAGAAEAGSAAS